ncbi:hypothetical protein AAF712_014590, partial [Marasmius tenuissimus]
DDGISIETDDHPATLTPYPPPGEVIVSEKQPREKETHSGEENTPDLEARREGRRDMRNGRTRGMIRRDRLNHLGSRSSGPEGPPPTYSEANLVR